MFGKAMGKIKDFDAVLLEPQIGYAKKDAEKDSEGKVSVDVIPMVDYGRMNAAGIIDFALKLLEGK